jgi:HAE1 family hydrophobic/amphiphilic exporter-1
LGLAVVGGLIFSQLITLYLTPVYYTYLEALTARIAGWRKTPARAASAISLAEKPHA